MTTRETDDFNDKLYLLKKNNSLTVKKLAEITNVSTHTLNAWLAGPLTGKRRNLDRHMFYFIKTKVLFHLNQGSYDQRSLTTSLIGDIHETLNKIKGKILKSAEVKNIDKAIENLEILHNRFHDLMPFDQAELELLKSFDIENNLSSSENPSYEKEASNNQVL